MSKDEFWERLMPSYWRRIQKYSAKSGVSCSILFVVWKGSKSVGILSNEKLKDTIQQRDRKQAREISSWCLPFSNTHLNPTITPNPTKLTNQEAHQPHAMRIKVSPSMPRRKLGRFGSFSWGRFDSFSWGSITVSIPVRGRSSSNRECVIPNTKPIVSYNQSTKDNRCIAAFWWGVRKLAICFLNPCVRLI
jgi:hypothetical protein